MEHQNVVEKNVAIPEHLIINGSTYSVKDTPEIQEFIKSVAKVEKSKLYTQIEQLREQAIKLERVQISPTPKVEAPSFDMDKFKEDISGIVGTLIDNKLAPITSESNRAKEQALNNYREELVNKNIDRCIPDLVRGSSKEEIDQSLAESIRLRASYPSPNTVEAQVVKDPLLQQTALDNKFQAETYIPSVPGIPAADPSSNQTDVKKMSMEEFAKQREALMNGMESLYGGK